MEPPAKRARLTEETVQPHYGNVQDDFRSGAPGGARSSLQPDFDPALENIPLDPQLQQVAIPDEPLPELGVPDLDVDDSQREQGPEAVHDYDVFDDDVFDDDVFDEEGEEEDDEQEEPDHLLKQQRVLAVNRFQQTMAGIFAKYERDFTDIGDEIDLETGQVVVNNGHLTNMRYEGDTGMGDELPCEAPGDDDVDDNDDDGDEGILLEDWMDPDEEGMRPGQENELDGWGESHHKLQEDSGMREADQPQTSVTETSTPYPEVPDKLPFSSSNNVFMGFEQAPDFAQRASPNPNPRPLAFLGDMDGSEYDSLPRPKPAPRTQKPDSKPMGTARPPRKWAFKKSIWAPTPGYRDEWWRPWTTVQTEPAKKSRKTKSTDDPIPPATLETGEPSKDDNEGERTPSRKQGNGGPRPSKETGVARKVARSMPRARAIARDRSKASKARIKNRKSTLFPKPHRYARSLPDAPSAADCRRSGRSRRPVDFLGKVSWREVLGLDVPEPSTSDMHIPGMYEDQFYDSSGRVPSLPTPPESGHDTSDNEQLLHVPQSSKPETIPDSQDTAPSKPSPHKRVARTKIQYVVKDASGVLSDDEEPVLFKKFVRPGPSGAAPAPTTSVAPKRNQKATKTGKIAVGKGASQGREETENNPLLACFPTGRRDAPIPDNSAAKPKTAASSKKRRRPPPADGIPRKRGRPRKNPLPPVQNPPEETGRPSATDDGTKDEGANTTDTRPPLLGVSGNKETASPQLPPNPNTAVGAAVGAAGTEAPIVPKKRGRGRPRKTEARPVVPDQVKPNKNPVEIKDSQETESGTAGAPTPTKPKDVRSTPAEPTIAKPMPGRAVSSQQTPTKPTALKPVASKQTPTHATPRKSTAVEEMAAKPLAQKQTTMSTPTKVAPSKQTPTKPTAAKPVLTRPDPTSLTPAKSNSGSIARAKYRSSSIHRSGSSQRSSGLAPPLFTASPGAAISTPTDGPGEDNTIPIKDAEMSLVRTSPSRKAQTKTKTKTSKIMKPTPLRTERPPEIIRIHGKKPPPTTEPPTIKPAPHAPTPDDQAPIRASKSKSSRRSLLSLVPDKKRKKERRITYESDGDDILGMEDDAVNVPKLLGSPTAKTWRASSLTTETRRATPVEKRRVERESPDRKIQTPGGTTRTCGVDGYMCGRDFCFTCL